MSTFRRRNPELLLEAQNFRARPSETDADIYRLLFSLDTPRSLAVWLLYKSGEHDQLTALEIDPGNYTNGFRFRHDYVATNLLSKASFLKTSFNREAVAIEKFRKFESLCRETNSRFRNPLLDPNYHGPNVWLLNATRRKVSEILGEYGPDEFVDSSNWGPGVSTLVKGEEVSGYNKFHAGRGITRDLYSLTSQWFSAAYPGWSAHLTETYGEEWQIFQVGNEIVTVPKNSKTDRVIAIEPDLNLWFQKGLGAMIRRRLARRGIDLNNQTRNQRLARSGSLSGDLATVDFSSASDSIATEVVRELIPPDWYHLLDTCRCRLGTLGGELIRWEKFSSMGNGFTFELESLIFYAAALAVCEYLKLPNTDVSVYGDDVILPSQGFTLFASFSAFLGFRVNPSKSFWDGPFRESCGEHYYDGVDCKPIFLKEKIRNVEAVFKLANGIRNLAHRYGFMRSCDARFLDCWSHLYLRLPEPLRLFVPREAGDTGLAGNFDEARPSRARYGIEGFFYRALGTCGVTRTSDGPAMIQARLRGQSTPSTAFVSEVEGRMMLLAPKSSLRRLACKLAEKDLPDRAYANTYPVRGRVKRIVTNSFVRQ